jgi:hypothetical protein
MVLSWEGMFGMTIYFIGCDIGGWHTSYGDAFAACKFSSGNLTHLGEKSGSMYYPVDPQEIFAKTLKRICEEQARLIIAIDAALAWPVEFVKLVQDAPVGRHLPTFTLPSPAIDNPYLYRETERFIEKAILRGSKKLPLTAPGDKFGNNCSKAQGLVAWIRTRLPGVYRPPFDPWDEENARNARYSLIEVYPAASMKSRLFRNLRWPRAAMQMTNVGDSDIGDAKRCAMTAVCYAATVRMEESLTTAQYPPVFLPDNTRNSNLITREGWIFAPAPE